MTNDEYSVAFRKALEEKIVMLDNLIHELRMKLAEEKTAAIRAEHKLDQILAIVKEY